MKVIYNQKEIPIVTKKTGKSDQIVEYRKTNEIRFRIILTNETCVGSVKPLVSITNQIIKKFENSGKYTIQDYFRKDLSYERILTIKL